MFDLSLSTIFGPFLRLIGTWTLLPISAIGSTLDFFGACRRKEAMGVTVITGASSGIGREIALVCARLPSHLAPKKILLAARRMHHLEDIKATIGDLNPAIQVSLVQYDARNQDDASLLYYTASSIGFGRNPGKSRDTLIINAGIPGVLADFESHRDTTDMENVMRVNYWAPVWVIQRFLKSVVMCQGKIIVVASVYGRIAATCQAGYCASKHAIVGFCDAIRPELAEKGVSISVHTPSSVGTELFTKFGSSEASTNHINVELPSWFVSSSSECAKSVLDTVMLRQDTGYFPWWQSRIFPSLRNAIGASRFDYWLRQFLFLHVWLGTIELKEVEVNPEENGMGDHDAPEMTERILSQSSMSSGNATLTMDYASILAGHSRLPPLAGLDDISILAAMTAATNIPSPMA